MLRDYPAVWCTNHGKQFLKISEGAENAGIQDLLTQYWEAACGCAVHVILALPDQEN